MDQAVDKVAKVGGVLALFQNNRNMFIGVVIIIIVIIGYYIYKSGALPFCKKGKPSAKKCKAKKSKKEEDPDDEGDGDDDSDVIDSLIDEIESEQAKNIA